VKTDIILWAESRPCDMLKDHVYFEIKAEIQTTDAAYGERDPMGITLLTTGMLAPQESWTGPTLCYTNANAITFHPLSAFYLQRALKTLNWVQGRMDKAAAAMPKPQRWSLAHDLGLLSKAIKRPISLCRRNRDPIDISIEQLALLESASEWISFLKGVYTNDIDPSLYFERKAAA
jgi:hypothetical protein